MNHAGFESDPNAGVLVIGKARFTVEESDRPGERVYWRWTCEVTINGIGEIWTDDDLGAPMIGLRGDETTPERRMLGSFLSFLGAAMEGRSYREQTGRDSENEDLFPAGMLDALGAVDVSEDDVTLAGMEVEGKLGE